MTTARDIIKTALRKIHVLGTGSSLDATEANDALGVLNGMLASFSAEGAMVYQDTKETFSLVSGQASYTVAVGGEFNTTAPLAIRASYVTQGSTDYPLTQYDVKEYAGIAQKDIEGSVPRVFYYDDNFPTANIAFYPVPSASTTFTMHSLKPLAQFDDLDGVLSMPAQYLAMLENNLSEWLAPEYEREPSRQLVKLASKTKKTVIVQNQRNEKNTGSITGVPTRDSRNQYAANNIWGGWFN